MPGHPTPADALLGGGTSRHHAELLLHSGDDGVSVKDLRLRRVVPPAAGSLDTFPECAAPVKPGFVEITPLEAVSAATAAAAGDFDRKLAPPRSKLVRDPRSFGYRRLLPFLNELTKNDSSIGKEVFPQDTAAHSKDVLGGSDSRLADEAIGVSHCEPEAMVVNTGGDTDVKDACNNVSEEIKIAPHDLTNKPLLAGCTRSRFVHHPSSFSYKRMLPFLMENDISAQECNRVKIRKIAEERQLASNENDVSASGQHCLAASDDSSQECNRGQVETMEEEKPAKADENNVLGGRQLQPPVLEAPPPDFSVVEMQNVMQHEASASSQVPLTSFEGELTSAGDSVQAVGEHQLVASEESLDEHKRDEVKRSIHDAVKSDGGYALDSREFQLAASEVSPENSMAEVQGAAQEESLPLDGVEERSDKGDFVSTEQAQLCVTNESLAAQLQGNVEFAEVPQCQNLDPGCHDVGFGSRTKRVIPLLHRHCAQQPQDSVVSLDDQLLDDDIQMICRPDSRAVDRYLSVEEMSGCIMLTESASNKAGISRPRGAHSMEKGSLSPKKPSPKKGILKRNTRGCKGICMCLDCCTFRLHADRAFEFSRKQMKEADDIITNLLKEVASLRSLLEKPAGQESTQAACRHASRVEEVARNSCQQMFVDLNSHCRIPKPRVRFTEYVEEKKALPSPRRSNRSR
ncbi:uncharacterized protein [Zea mays]|uniref:Putative aldehyde dehydrogenase family protein n=1 Tax=Zea mays TaxID=4577 RepID=A0A1D6FCH5_MAIZE|nr:uncharacterized protein LOC103634718 isoform X2 [Zea mays]AQK89731.1 Putative aldehyde dehydrogenase family protein [Zea mays]|eukprot:XP_008655523.1 uncharacterized protein LOC103634718 isoform X2 [Zea mays]